MLRISRKLLAFGVLSAAILAASIASACPNCKDALADQTGEAAKLKDGYFASIMLMIATPFALLGTGAYCVTRLVKRGAFPEL
jgi:heme/copper-type cytochrome/quinol oxidase subunit 2